MLDRITLLDVRRLAQNYGPDTIFLEVHRQSHDAPGKLKHLVGHSCGKAAHARDAVAHLLHPAHLYLLQLRFEVGDVALERRRDVLGTDP